MMFRERTRKPRKPTTFSANADQSEPQPCKRYAKMVLNGKFIAHLPACDPCRNVVAYLNRESEMKLAVSRPVI